MEHLLFRPNTQRTLSFCWGWNLQEMHARIHLVLWHHKFEPLKLWPPAVCLCFFVWLCRPFAWAPFVPWSSSLFPWGWQDFSSTWHISWPQKIRFTVESCHNVESSEMLHVFIEERWGQGPARDHLPPNRNGVIRNDMHCHRVTFSQKVYKLRREGHTHNIS